VRTVLNRYTPKDDGPAMSDELAKALDQIAL
jgi:hypothetical protein